MTVPRERDIDSLIYRLLHIKDGETVEYYRGELGRDRELLMNGSDKWAKLERLCETAWRLGEEGRVLLCQRREGVESVYLAVGIGFGLAARLVDLMDDGDLKRKGR